MDRTMEIIETAITHLDAAVRLAQETREFNPAKETAEKIANAIHAGNRGAFVVSVFTSKVMVEDAI
jgi:hypothetical protein